MTLYTKKDMTNIKNALSIDAEKIKKKKQLEKKRSMSPLQWSNLHKKLSKFHKFSFNNSKKMSWQQKNALFKKNEQLKSLITLTKKGNGTFIPITKKMKVSKKKLKEVEGIHTNKGLFFKIPNAKLKINKKTREVFVQTKNNKRVDIYYPFPKSIRFDFEKMSDYVDKLIKRKHSVIGARKKLYPSQVAMSVYGHRANSKWDASIFLGYAMDDFSNKSEGELSFWTGVFLIFDVGN